MPHLKSNALIYLDTSQISEFAATPTTGLRGDELAQIWNRKELALCLSLQHIHEIASLEDEESRKQRVLSLEKIDQLLFAELGWPSIIQSEIILQIVKTINAEKQKKISLPRIVIWKRVSAEFLCDYIEKNISLQKRGRRIHEAECTMQEQYRLIGKEMKRYKIRGPIFLKDLDRNNKDAIISIIELMRSGASFSNLSIIFKGIAEIEKAGSLEEMLGIKSMPGIKQRYLSDLASLSVFLRLARESVPLISKMTGLTGEAISSFIYNINPASCQAFSLRMALLRAIKSSDKRYAPSDWADADHIVYAPFVDAFYADKRTCDFLEKETRNRSFPIAQSFVANIRRNAHLKAEIERVE